MSLFETNECFSSWCNIIIGEVTVGCVRSTDVCRSVSSELKQEQKAESNQLKNSRERERVRDSLMNLERNSLFPHPLSLIRSIFLLLVRINEPLTSPSFPSLILLLLLLLRFCSLFNQESVVAHGTSDQHFLLSLEYD